MNSRILIYQGAYQYGAANRFAVELGDAFCELGREVAYVDLTDAGSLKENLQRELSKSCDFILSVGAVGSDFQLAGKSLYDSLPFPLVTLLIDHPAHHFDRLNSSNTIVTCYDQSHIDFLSYCSFDHKREVLLRHGGCAWDKALGTNSTEPIFDVLFAGSWIDPDQQFSAIETLPPELYQLAVNCATEVLNHDELPVAKAMLELAIERGILFFETYNKIASFAQVVSMTEMFVRAVKRREILDLLDQSGVVVDIFGNNWPENIFQNHRLHPAKEFGEIVPLMRQAKLTLNMIMVPGSHERPLTAMRNGAAVISDHNEFFSANFADDKEIFLYKWLERDQLPEQIIDLLGNDELRTSVAENGRLAVESKHTWRHRAEELLEIVSRA